jgi:hypothetical protein
LLGFVGMVLISVVHGTDPVVRRLGASKPSTLSRPVRLIASAWIITEAVIAFLSKKIGDRACSVGLILER